MYSWEGWPWPSPPDTGMSLQDRHVNTVKQAARAGHSSPGSPLQQRRYVRWNYFVYGLNAKALSQLFPHSTELGLISLGHLGFVTLRMTLS